jgi:hypothetical protein
LQDEPLDFISGRAGEIFDDVDVARDLKVGDLTAAIFYNVPLGELFACFGHDEGETDFA